VEIYTGSADWMPRNLYERVEVLTPVRDTLLRERIRREILEAYLADNVKARFLQRDGSYVRVGQIEGTRHKPKSRPFNSQTFLVALAEGKATVTDIPRISEPKARTLRAPRDRVHKER
jgi:polyphosphate kinase